MLKQDLILRNPLRLLGKENEDIIRPGNFGAVLARHGVGKTAMVIQLSLNSLLQQKNVLHISLKLFPLSASAVQDTWSYSSYSQGVSSPLPESGSYSACAAP